MSDGERGERDTSLSQGLGVFVAVILCCLIVGVLTFSWGRDSERDSQRTAKYQHYAEKRESAFCIGLTGSGLAKCQIEQEQTAREAYNAERDLNAQRDMSLWALAVFIISAITAGLTLWALWYVRGTMIATLKAVEDTSEATKAMQEANEIARIAQRPWLKIEARITKAKHEDGILTLSYQAWATNTGKMVAERCALRADILDCDFNPQGQRRIQELRAEAANLASRTEFGARIPFPILPGEMTKLAGQTEATGDFPAYDALGYGRRTSYVVFVCACYHVPGESDLRVTERAFSISYAKDADRDDLLLPHGIPIPLPQDLSEENVFLRPAGYNRTT